MTPPASLAAAVSWRWANQLFFSRSAGIFFGGEACGDEASSFFFWIFLGNFERISTGSEFLRSKML